jgi:hypothetical protein
MGWKLSDNQFFERELYYQFWNSLAVAFTQLGMPRCPFREMNSSGTKSFHCWCATMKPFESPGYGNSTPDVLALKIFTPKIAPLNKQWKGNDKDQWERIIHCELHSLLLQIGDQVQEAEKKNREFSLTSWLSRKRSTSSCWTCSSGNRCQWLDFRSQAQFRDSHKVGPKSKRDQNVISGTWICNLSERKWYLLSRLFRSSLVAQQIIWKTRF